MSLKGVVIIKVSLLDNLKNANEFILISIKFSILFNH